MGECASGIVRRVDEHAFYLACELRLQRLQCKQVVAEYQPIVENVLSVTRCSRDRTCPDPPQNPGSSLRPFSLPIQVSSSFCLPFIANSYCPLSGWGTASQVRPSSMRPFRFFPRLCPSTLHVPHCLKKKATPCSSQSRFTFNTHSCFIGRALGPDSPPAMTQCTACQIYFGEVFQQGFRGNKANRSGYLPQNIDARRP